MIPDPEHGTCGTIRMAYHKPLMSSRRKTHVPAACQCKNNLSPVLGDEPPPPRARTVSARNQPVTLLRLPVIGELDCRRSLEPVAFTVVRGCTTLKAVNDQPKFNNWLPD